MLSGHHTDREIALFSSRTGAPLAVGHTGAVIGPMVTAHLVVPIGFENLLPLSAMLLLFAVYCVYRLRDWVQEQSRDDSAQSQGKAIGGSAIEGIRLTLSTPYYRAIAAALVCANFLGVFVYIYMAEIVSQSFDSTDERTQVFAWIDVAINMMAFIGQMFLVKHAVRKIGVGWTLALLPICALIGLLLLAVHPVFAVMAGIHIRRRSITFGFAKPTSDMLYSVVPKNAKYKVKNFIETAVYRGGDLASAWTIGWLGALGISGVALASTPVAAIFTVLVFWIGKEYYRRDAELTQKDSE